MALLIEARNYVAYRQSGDVKDMEGGARLLVSQETMRITCRLTQAMAWLLCQRAVETGELTDEEALHERFAIGGETVCFDEQWSDDDRLPAPVRDLLARTHALYSQVHRLDDMIRNTKGAALPTRADGRR